MTLRFGGFTFQSVLRTRRFNLTSYFELSLAPHNADLQHPAFNKLFIQTEASLNIKPPRVPPTSRGGRPTIYVAHRLTLEHPRTKPCSSRPTGADSSAEDGRSQIRWGPPEAWQQPGLRPGPDPQPAPEPDSRPGQRVQVSLVLAAGETRQQVLG